MRGIGWPFPFLPLGSSGLRCAVGSNFRPNQSPLGMSLPCPYLVLAWLTICNYAASQMRDHAPNAGRAGRTVIFVFRRHGGLRRLVRGRISFSPTKA